MCSILEKVVALEVFKNIFIVKCLKFHIQFGHQPLMEFLKNSDNAKKMKANHKLTYWRY